MRCQSTWRKLETPRQNAPCGDDLHARNVDTREGGAAKWTLVKNFASSTQVRARFDHWYPGLASRD